jgi:hypothetical protein
VNRIFVVVSAFFISTSLYSAWEITPSTDQADVRVRWSEHGLARLVNLLPNDPYPVDSDSNITLDIQRHGSRERAQVVINPANQSIVVRYFGAVSPRKRARSR